MRVLQTEIFIPLSGIINRIDQNTLQGNLISKSRIVCVSNNSSSLLINTSITHHALAEVVGVHPWQRAHEQREHVRAALWVVVVRGNQAAGHADHAAESGGEGVRLRQGRHRRIGSVNAQDAKRYAIRRRAEVPKGEAT